VPIMQFVFERGAWTHDATLATAAVIMILCIGLPAMSIGQIYQKTLYAAQDMKTPVKMSIISLVVSGALFIALFPWIGFLSVPVGTVVGGYLRDALLIIACRRKGLFKVSAQTLRKCAMFLGLSFAMGVGLWAVRDAGLITGLFSLGAVIALAAALYMPIALLVNKKLK